MVSKLLEQLSPPIESRAAILARPLIFFLLLSRLLPLARNFSTRAIIERRRESGRKLCSRERQVSSDIQTRRERGIVASPPPLPFKQAKATISYGGRPTDRPTVSRFYPRSIFPPDPVVSIPSWLMLTRHETIRALTLRLMLPQISGRDIFDTPLRTNRKTCHDFLSLPSFNPLDCCVRERGKKEKKRKTWSVSSLHNIESQL